MKLPYVLFDLTPNQWHVLTFGLILAGFVTACVVRRRETTRLDRSSWLLAVAAMSFLLFVSFFQQFLITRALVQGWYPVLSCVMLTTRFVVGYGLGAASLARARSAGMRPWASLLALVPVANLILLFRRPTDFTTANPLRIRGFAFRVLAACLFAAIVPVLNGVQARFRYNYEYGKAHPETAAEFITALVERGGIERAVRWGAEAIVGGGSKRNFTAKAAGNLLIFDKVFATGATPDGIARARVQLRDGLCDDPLGQVLLAGGAVILFRARDLEGELLTELRLTEAECTAWPLEPEPVSPVESRPPRDY